MSWVAVAVVGSSLIGGLAQSSAASSAANAQVASNTQSIAAQQDMFNKVQANLQPYMQAGTGALSQQQNLLGLGGAQAQTDAINALSNSPQMQSLLTQGENAMRQNASATGGLRGGNFQAALAQFRPQLLNQLISSQFTNLGGLTALGQSAAAGVGNAGMQSASNIGNLLSASGQAQAAGIMGGANAFNNALQGAVGGLSGYNQNQKLLNLLGGKPIV